MEMLNSSAPVQSIYAFATDPENHYTSFNEVRDDLQDKKIPVSSSALKRIPLRTQYVGKMRELALAKKGAVKLTSGEPDFPTPSHIVEAAKKALDDGYTHYTSSRGLPEFCAAISQSLKNRGVDYKPSQVLVSEGAIQGIYLAAMAFLDAGDECIIADPGYTSYEAIVSMVGGKAIPVGVDETTQNLTSEAVASAFTPKTKLVILNSPSNPTGGIIPLKELRSIIEVCRERGILVLSDEAYDNIVYEGSTFHSVLQVSGMEENTIYVNTLSKTYAMTGWRIGYLAARQDIIDALATLQTYVALSVSTASQMAGVAALSGPQDSIKLMVKEFQERRDAVTRALNRVEGVSCPSPQGAFYSFPQIDFGGMGSYDLSRHLLEKGNVGVYPGIGFGRRGEGRIRISFSTSKDLLTEGIRRIAQALGRSEVASG